MPVIVIFEDPEVFYDDDSSVHEILGENGFQRGDYPVIRPMPPIILLPELNDDAISQLEELDGVQVKVENDDD